MMDFPHFILVRLVLDKCNSLQISLHTIQLKRKKSHNNTTSHRNTGLSGNLNFQIWSHEIVKSEEMMNTCIQNKNFVYHTQKVNNTVKNTTISPRFSKNGHYSNC